MEIGRIKADIYTAAMLLDCDASGVPFLKDLAAYHTQQALENCLKYYLNNVYGVSKKSPEYFAHNIASLFIAMDGYDKNFIAKYRELAAMSNKISSWESMGRYSDMEIVENNADLLQVSKVLGLTKNMYDEILESEKLNKNKVKNKAKNIKQKLKNREEKSYEK